MLVRSSSRSSSVAIKATAYNFQKYFRLISFILLLSLLWVMPTPVLAASSAGAVANNITEDHLPTNDVKRFVASIAMVEHYYVKKVSVNKLFEQALKGMIGQLDPHSAYLNKEDLRDLRVSSSGEFTGIGVEILAEKGVLKVISPLDGSPAKKAGMRSGDYILKVDGKVVRGVDTREMIKDIRGLKGTVVKLLVLHKDEAKPVLISIKRDVIVMQAVRTKELEPGFAYLRLASFQEKAPKQMRKKIIAMQKKMQKQNIKAFRGVILDLRNNPGGLLTAGTEISNIFLTKQDKKRHDGLIVYTKGRDKTSQMKVKMHPEDLLNGAPLVVLINGGSASASEILAGVLQDDKRAVIIGEKSFGKGSVQTVFPLGDDAALKLTTSLYYTPAGREIQAKGIDPDILVPQLNIQDKDQPAFQVNESDFNGHIANNGVSKDTKKEDQAENNHKTEFALAQDDYQLYQALMIVKGMHTHSRY
jgi:carboxyl-terminal processing protease